MATNDARRRRALVAIFLSTFANYLTITILTIALRPITTAFDASVDDAAWVQLAPALVSGLLTPAFGRLSDSLGRVFVFRAGVVLTSVGTLGCALAPTLGALVLARLVTGVGTALAMPSGLALASALYPPSRRDVPVGIWTSITAFAPALGVLIGGIVVERFSWRYLFVGQLPFSALSLLLTVGAVGESREESRGRFDALGAALFGTSVFAVTLVANRVNQWGLGSPLVLGLTACVVVMLPWFVRVERDAETPVLPLRLLADPVVVWATVTRCLMYAVHMGSFIVLPLYLMDVARFGPAEVALALLPRPIAMGFAAPAVPWLSRRLGPSRVTLLGCISMLLGVGTMPFLEGGSTSGVLLAGLLLMGAGLGVSQTTTASELSARARVDDLGATSALLSISTAVAGALGTAALLALATRDGTPTAAAYRSSFVASTALAAVALATAFRYVAMRRRHASPAGAD